MESTAGFWLVLVAIIGGLLLSFFLVNADTPRHQRRAPGRFRRRRRYD